MAPKTCIIPVRVTREDRALFESVAPDGAVSSWLREVAREVATRRRAAMDLRGLLDRLAVSGPGLDAGQAMTLAVKETRAVRRGRRR